MFARTEKRKLSIRGDDYEYTLKRRPYTKHIRLSIGRDGALSVSAPATYPIFLLKIFLGRRFDWIIKNIERLKNNPSILAVKHSELEKSQYKKQTKILVKSRLEYFNQFYYHLLGVKFIYHRISIRNQKSRWGSCSSAKNLNFNYRLCLLSPELADYIIAHELCHTKEMNHSPAFWQLVARLIPDYKFRQKLLKKI